MLYHSNKLTEQEVKEVLDEFFLAHRVTGTIETFSDGSSKRLVENNRFLLADLRKANRKLLNGGFELQLGMTDSAKHIFVYFRPLLHIESQYEQI